MIDQRGAMIEQLWQEHRAAVFPAGYTGKEVEGIDLALLDSDTAGCILTFLKNGGELDLWRTAILGLCYRDASIVARSLSGEAYDYFLRLETLSRLVLEAVREAAKTA